MISIAPTAPARAGWFTQTGQVLRRWLLVSLRQAWGPVMSLIQPVIWILLFGQVFHSLGALPQFAGAGYIAYLVPGILMMTVLYSGAWAGTGCIDDIASGVMDQYLTSPISRSAIVTGQLIQQLVVNLAQSLVVLGIGWLAGARYPGGVGGMLVALGVATLLATIFCCCSTAVALMTRSQIALISLSQLIVLPATFLSTTMMPAALLPEWVQNVSRWNPMTWAVELGRGGLDGTYPADGWWQLAGLVLLAALAFTWAVRSIRAYQRSI
ncbi:ABC transporter permease [Microbacterium ulmi]|uniref:Transport permease protein n=1 Tax=Microbacterium ulmi TaxID=179095 RepID=A0A7Y2LZG6_9MICO|nr:ABC transporter permease [Microbacterium ulmi]NII68766.1 ABC-2 type transport system permease protein [Microbacterium ulmi]NNH03577.1 ABC transporter permease [Microbacterium ulmi]